MRIYQDELKQKYIRFEAVNSFQKQKDAGAFKAKYIIYREHTNSFIIKIKNYAD